MNVRKTLTTAFVVCGIGLAFCGGILAANHHLFRSVFEPDTRLAAADVPVRVLNAYKARFPDALQAVWETEDDLFEVSIYENGILTEASFEHDGTWVCTGRPGLLENLPAGAREHLMSQAGQAYRVGDIVRMEFADMGPQWEVELKNKLYAWDFLYDENGQLLEEERDSVAEND